MDVSALITSYHVRAGTAPGEDPFLNSDRIEAAQVMAAQAAGGYTHRNRSDLGYDSALEKGGGPRTTS